MAAASIHIPADLPASPCSLPLSPSLPPAPFSPPQHDLRYVRQMLNIRVGDVVLVRSQSQAPEYALIRALAVSPSSPHARYFRRTSLLPRLSPASHSLQLVPVADSLVLEPLTAIVSVVRRPPAMPSVPSTSNNNNSRRAMTTAPAKTCTAATAPYPTRAGRPSILMPTSSSPLLASHCAATTAHHNDVRLPPSPSLSPSPAPSSPSPTPSKANLSFLLSTDEDTATTAADNDQHPPVRTSSSNHKELSIAQLLVSFSANKQGQSQQQQHQQYTPALVRKLLPLNAQLAAGVSASARAILASNPTSDIDLLVAESAQALIASPHFDAVLASVRAAITSASAGRDAEKQPTADRDDSDLSGLRSSSSASYLFSADTVDSTLSCASADAITRVFSYLDSQDATVRMTGVSMVAGFSASEYFAQEISSHFRVFLVKAATDVDLRIRQKALELVQRCVKCCPHDEYAALLESFTAILASPTLSVQPEGDLRVWLTADPVQTALKYTLVNAPTMWPRMGLEATRSSLHTLFTFLFGSGNSYPHPLTWLSWTDPDMPCLAAMLQTSVAKLVLVDTLAPTFAAGTWTRFTTLLDTLVLAPKQPQTLGFSMPYCDLGALLTTLATLYSFASTRTLFDPAGTFVALLTRSQTALAGAKDQEAQTMSGNKSDIIVTFKEGTPKEVVDQEAQKVEAAGGKIKQRYDGTVLLGFAAQVPDAHFSTLSAHKDVDAVEADGEVSLHAKQHLKK
ncbi:hypothetical protein RI367_004571 [Sorochytrium milnesiophthora]